MNILITILLSTFKFAMTFPLAILEFKFSFFETILWINIGGVIGIYFFAYLSEAVNRWIQGLINKGRKKRGLEEKEGNLQSKSYGGQRKKKIFTKRNRRIVRIKQKYGLIGIALTTPLFLSIPIGVFLAVRYYPRSKTKYLYLIGSNVAWSFVYTSFYMFWNNLLFKG